MSKPAISLSAAAPPSALTIAVSETGEIAFLWNDDLADLMELGSGAITRASHVEPAGTQWLADLSPVGGPTLGPFALRSHALIAEAAWLEDNEFGRRGKPS